MFIGDAEGCRITFIGLCLSAVIAVLFTCLLVFDLFRSVSMFFMFLIMPAMMGGSGNGAQVAMAAIGMIGYFAILLYSVFSGTYGVLPVFGLIWYLVLTAPLAVTSYKGMHDDRQGFL
ncbi:MAG: hypothetical protein ACI38Y_01235 [Candidatus Methanomethylophilaceae archaeon]